jgi:hypothetical protein
MNIPLFSRRVCPPCAELSTRRLRGEQARRLNLVVFGSLAAGMVALLWWVDPAELNLPLCAFHNATGLDCPGCGAIRATHELLHGRLLTAWHYNALWVLTLPLVVYLTVSEWRFCCGRRPLPGNLARRAWFWLVILAAAMAFFVLRNL